MHLLFWSRLLVATALLQFNWQPQNPLRKQESMKIPLISLGPCSSSSNDISKKESYVKQHQFSKFSIVFHSSVLLSTHLLFHDENLGYPCVLVIHIASQKKSTSKIFYEKTWGSFMLKKLHDYNKPTPKYLCALSPHAFIREIYPQVLFIWMHIHSCKILGSSILSYLQTV